MAQAVTRLWPGAHYAIGPAIRDGFYYDFELPGGDHFSDDDLERIDAEMRAIVAEDQPFVRSEYSIEEGLELFADQPFKVEIIDAVAPGGQRGGPRRGRQRLGGVDLRELRRRSATCAVVPTCPSTARLGHFKSDARRRRLLARRREDGPSSSASTARPGSPRRRSRRTSNSSTRPRSATIGASAHELDLFSFPTEIGPGLAVFHPKGGTMRRVMEDYSRDAPRATAATSS